MTETIRRPHLRSAFAAIGLAVALAACGGEPTATAPDCPAEAPTPLPTPPYHQDPELEARLPDEIDGQPLEIQSVCATVAGSQALTLSQQMLDAVGVELQDVTIARNPGPEPGQTGYVGVTAWRYAGADEATVRDAFRAVLEEAELPAEQDTIASKEVDRAQFHVYYVADDTLYSVLGEDDDVEAVIEALP